MAVILCTREEARMVRELKGEIPAVVDNVEPALFEDEIAILEKAVDFILNAEIQIKED